MKSNILAIAILSGILPTFSQPVYAPSKSPILSEIKTAAPLRDSLAQAEPIKITGVKILDNQIAIENSTGTTLGQLRASSPISISPMRRWRSQMAKNFASIIRLRELLISR